jgi:hypothetical protein
MINGHRTPIFVENSHERPFSIIPKANTYRFFTKKWSLPEILECDLWQEMVSNTYGFFYQEMVSNTYGFFYEEMVSTKNPRK